MSTRDLPYSDHCAICGETFAQSRQLYGSHCHSCASKAARPAGWLMPTLGGLIEASGYVLPLAAAVLLFLALRAL